MNTHKIATWNVDSLRVRAGMVGARSPGYFVFAGNQDEYCWLDYESAQPAARAAGAGDTGWAEKIIRPGQS